MSVADNIDLQSGAPDGEQSPSAAPAGEAPDPLASLQAEVERLAQENLKLLAEMRNMQQRTRRDLEERLRYADADFAREMLPVLDDLLRIVESAGPSPDGAATVQGVKLVIEGFERALKARRIEPIPAAGQPFDPHVHEALVYQPSTEAPAGSVMHEVARGYRLQDRVIRAAKVVVSSGPARSD